MTVIYVDICLFMGALKGVFGLEEKLRREK